MDCHCKRVNQNGNVAFFFFLLQKRWFFLYHFSPPSSSPSLINSNEQTLVAAHVSYAHLNLSFQSVSQIYLTKNQSNYIAEDAKTSTLPNLHDTAPSMVLTSGPPSLIFSFSSTQPSSHQKTSISFNKTLKTSVRLILGPLDDV